VVTLVRACKRKEYDHRKKNVRSRSPVSPCPLRGRRSYRGGVALLLAPKSGKELRKDIKDIASETREKIATTVEKGKELYVESTAAVKNAFEAGKTAYIQEMEKHRKAAYKPPHEARSSAESALLFLSPPVT